VLYVLSSTFFVSVFPRQTHRDENQIYHPNAPKRVQKDQERYWETHPSLTTQF
jgi:hypothetical protein